MKNNKGMSLVEIIIIIAILAILAGSTVGAMRYMHYGNTKNCANEINAMIEKTRIQAMSKANKPYLYLYQFNGSYYMKIMGTEVANPETQLDATGSLVANSQVDLFYTTTDPAAPEVEIQQAVPPNAAVYMKLGFVKNTGGIKPMDASTYCYNEILVKDQDGMVQYRITLVEATGKHILSK